MLPRNQPLIQGGPPQRAAGTSGGTRSRNSKKIQDNLLCFVFCITRCFSWLFLLNLLFTIKVHASALPRQEEVLLLLLMLLLLLLLLLPWIHKSIRKLVLGSLLNCRLKLSPASLCFSPETLIPRQNRGCQLSYKSRVIFVLHVKHRSSTPIDFVRTRRRRNCCRLAGESCAETFPSRRVALAYYHPQQCMSGE